LDKKYKFQKISINNIYHGQVQRSCHAQIDEKIKKVKKKEKQEQQAEGVLCSGADASTIL